MMSKEKVSHSGVITNILDESIEVQILSKSACAACNIKSACNIAEMQEKKIMIPKPDDRQFSIGQNVTVSMTIKQGNKAVVYAYLIPAILIIVMVFTLNAFNIDEGLNAMISVGSLIPYYLILFLLRKKLKSKFEYIIE